MFLTSSPTSTLNLISFSFVVGGVRTQTPNVGGPPGFPGVRVPGFQGVRTRRMGPGGVGPHIMFQMGSSGPPAITVSSGGGAGPVAIDS